MDLLNYVAGLIDVESVSVSGKAEPNIISTATKVVEMIVGNVGSMVEVNSDTIRSVMRTGRIAEDGSLDLFISSETESRLNETQTDVVIGEINSTDYKDDDKCLNRKSELISLVNEHGDKMENVSRLENT
eukprot:TRINITY_DN3708_c0_g1_i12.p1 TRINITY_DN3708_c0_g1~~TRINITY_DN3708_c0_g1_i12.p1  ORF type:complete len:130 (-),score=13.47 TRINITY_DN3708_c0_g1_i12:502-891(-)